MRVIGFALIGTCALIVGCPFMVVPDNSAAVLEGTWSVTPVDPGDFEGFEYEGVFDSNGNLVQLSAEGPNGEMATLTFDNTTTELDGSAVTITIPRPTGTRIFEGALSDDQNTMIGSVTQEINLGDLEIVLPGGDLTFERITDEDPCADVMCDPGETCVEGECVPEDPCAGVTCDPGETCVEGKCTPEDPCAAVTCDPGDICVEGECVPEDLCVGVLCATCQTCVEGVCQPLEGNPVAGAEFYTANGCANCHGANAEGVIGPSLIGSDCATIFDHLSGSDPHPITVEGVAEQDTADLEAWLASL